MRLMRVTGIVGLLRAQAAIVFGETPRIFATASTVR
jgi:hypothetical protein